MDPRTRSAYRRCLYALRDECNPLLPTTVRLDHRPSTWFGSTHLTKGGDRLVITLKTQVLDRSTDLPRDLSRQELLDTLVHEWAHALAWTGRDEGLDHHDALWGVAYAQCYQATTED